MAAPQQRYKDATIEDLDSRRWRQRGGRERRGADAGAGASGTAAPAAAAAAAATADSHSAASTARLSSAVSAFSAASVAAAAATAADDARPSHRLMQPPLPEPPLRRLRVGMEAQLAAEVDGECTWPHERRQRKVDQAQKRLSV